jgi:hypothetical protein
MRQLVPFSPFLSIQIEAEATKDIHQQLNVVFELRGDLSQIYLPELAALPRRRDELWKRTCFELFFAPNDSQNYWEINLSPTGEWNAYSFENYRVGMKQESKIQNFQIRTEKSTDSFRLEASADLSDLKILALGKLKISATAVIETLDGKISFWAFRHCGNTPDFHLRESFIAEI